MVRPSGQPLKIGFVLDGGLKEPYGIQQYILALGEYYKPLGHTVRYIVPSKARYGSKDVVTLPISSRRRLKSYLDNERFDVLHVQNPYLPTLGERLVYLSDSNTALIGTFHTFPRSWFVDVCNRALAKWCYFSLRRFDYFVSVSEPARVIAERNFGIKSEVLPNVIDYKKYKEAKPLAKTDNSLTILFIGRLIERKGSLELLKAVNILAGREGLPDFKVVICGKGPLMPRLQAYVNKHGLEDIVKFKGFISEEQKPRQLASADISVFPSVGGESFGIVLLEAMASGRSAVLAADNVGYESVLKDYPDQLFKRRDAVGLADKIENLLINDSKRLSIASKGSQYSSAYDVGVIGSKLLSIYTQALINKRS